ncbi:type II secretion system F family protein [Pseudooctadecabacter sp.]|uniref:type II secretion system F family protein n=1 Tax=Pseudooctadecabacter sp. TaxID=1966338 RepID=UPI0035C7F6E5
MTMEPRYILYFAILVSVVLFFEGIRQMFFDENANDPKTQRLRALSGGDQVETAMAQLRRKVDRPAWTRIPILGQLPGRMAQAGLTISPKRVFVMSGLAMGVTLFLGSPFVGIPVAALAAVFVGFVAPVGYINIVRNRRVDAFSRQLPDALDQMKRGLSVGHPVNTTIRAVASNMPDPVATEFQRMADQVVYGDSLPDAIEDMARRMDIEDTYYLAASIRIQHGTGGNLAAMLATLSTVIRNRFAMRRRIKAVSSEGRISAILLSALPFVMYVGTLLTAPDYYTSVQDDPLFYPMCAAILFFVIGNGLILRRLVNFKY